MTLRVCALLLGLVLTGSSLPVRTSASAMPPAMTRFASMLYQKATIAKPFDRAGQIKALEA